MVTGRLIRTIPTATNVPGAELVGAHGYVLAERLGLFEVFGGAAGRPPKSFPSALPLFRLDRIYVRGLAVTRSEVHFGEPWSRISDHAALSAHLASA